MIVQTVSGGVFKMQKSEGQKVGGRGFAAIALRGVVAGLLVILVLLAVFTSFVSSGRVPEGAMGTMTWIASFLGSFAGSVLAVRMRLSRALPMGLCVAFSLFALTLIGSAFSADGALLGPMTGGLLTALVGGGVLASFISPRKKTSAKSRKR